MQELSVQKLEIEKQKKKLKAILLVLEEQCQITKQMTESLLLEDGE